MRNSLALLRNWLASLCRQLASVRSFVAPLRSDLAPVRSFSSGGAQPGWRWVRMFYGGGAQVRAVL